MYVAEIKGKLPPSIRRSEDLLTSNVFSFFNYSKRTVYLKSLIDKLHITVDEKELNEAEFLFWPTYEDGTEPDLVLIIGKYYILFEAKYYSGFGKKTVTTESQLIREIKRGLMDADNIVKTFMLVTITADYCYKSEKFKEIEDYKEYFQWINWQSVAEILLRFIENDEILPNKLFASDLLRLLEVKKLRAFRPFKSLTFSEVTMEKENIFLNSETTMHRGKFIGFKRILEITTNIEKIDGKIFYLKKYFKKLPICKIEKKEKIFYERSVDGKGHN